MSCSSIYDIKINFFNYDTSPIHAKHVLEQILVIRIIINSTDVGILIKLTLFIDIYI